MKSLRRKRGVQLLTPLHPTATKEEQEEKTGLNCGARLQPALVGQLARVAIRVLVKVAPAKMSLPPTPPPPTHTPRCPSLAGRRGVGGCRDSHGRRQVPLK